MKSLAVVFWLLLFFVIPEHSPGMTGDNDLPGSENAGISASAGRDTLDKELVTLLQSRLKNTRTVILSYALKAGELQVRVITGENVHTLSQPAGSVFFSRLLALKNSLQARTGFDRKLAHQLYEKLIGPVKPYLKGKAHLVIIPCKNTGLIPFEALVPDTASGRYLLHDFAISYSYSLSALTSPGSRPSDYDRQKVLALAPFNIPATQKEIMNIKADHVLGRSASLERFLEKARDYSIIHLATYAAIKDPPNSFIDFNPGKAGKAGAPEARTSGSRLFTRDISGLNLENVSLVVLSPCQAAQRNTDISGLYTMAQAFARAGCPNFITSLWETEEETTHKISMKLHQYIHKGYGYAQALQKARIDYLDNPVIDEKLKSPGYWAGFILLGEINTVPQSHKIFYYFALAFTVLVVVCILRRRNHC